MDHSAAMECRAVWPILQFLLDGAGMLSAHCSYSNAAAGQRTPATGTGARHRSPAQEPSTFCFFESRESVAMFSAIVR